MTKTYAAVLAVLILASPHQTTKADYEAGLIAYGQGDYRTALKEWKFLAETGSDRAQFNLAFMYDNGQGVTHNYETAAQWYRAAAEQGHPDAAWNLGMMYTSGQGVPQDYIQAYKWLSVSALFGDESGYEDRAAISELLTEQQRNEVERWLSQWRPKPGVR